MALGAAAGQRGEPRAATARGGRTLVAGFVGAVIFLAVALYFSLRGVGATATLVESLRRERLLPERIVILLADAETAQRGYLLTHRREYLEPLARARREIPGVVAALAAFDPGRADDHLVNDVRALAEAKLDELDETLALDAKSGPAAALESVRTDAGQRLMEQARDEVAELRESVEARLAAEVQAAEQRTGLATILVALSSLALAFATVALFSTRRSEARATRLEEDYRRGLEAERDRIAELVEELPAAIATLAVPGLVVEAANARLRSLGPSAEGRKLTEAFPSLPAKLLDRIGDAATGGAPVAARAVTLVDAATRWDLAVAALRGRDGKITRLLLHAVEVTAAEQARAEVEDARVQLAESERRLRTLVSSTAQVVFTLDAAGRLVGDSAGWRTFTGLADEDLNRDPFAPVVAADRPRVLTAWRDAHAGGRPFGEDYRVRREGAKEAWVSVTLVPVVDEGGAVREWVGTAVDVTEARQTEALRELVIGMLGHDLRAPVTAIKIGAELALRRGLPENQARVIGRILNATDRMARMIDQALDFARARLGGGLAVRPERMDLGEAVSRILAEHDLAHPDRRVALEQRGDVTGSWDEARLGQVVANLVGNAHKYSPPEVVIGVLVDGSARQQVVLEVKNEGPPIPPDLQRVLFEPFRRGTFRKSGGEDGLGLGLFISQQLVLAHGGELAVTSTAEAGTCFRVTLPREPLALEGRPV